MKTRIRFGWIGVLSLFAVVSFVLTEIAQAQGSAQAFGVHGKDDVTGMRAYIWTAQQANMNNNWVASPVGVCNQTPPCMDDAFVETGYIKEHGKIPEAPDNVLQQYTSWADGLGNFGSQYNLGNLNDNALYEFMVFSQKKNNRWAIKRDGVQRWTWSYDKPGFSRGRMVLCGAEAWLDQTNIAVQCSQMQYRFQNTWTLFNFTDTQTSTDYCVFKPFDFGATGWGPC